MNEILSLIIEKSVIIFGIIGLSFGVAMYTTLLERKLAAVIQDRRGPNRAGPFGLFQPLADGLKLFFKEEIIPTQSNKILFILGPSLAMTIALMVSAVIPWTSNIEIGGKLVIPQVADVNIGILYVFAVVSMSIYGILLGAWASNNKFSLLAAIRASSQIISYELPLGLCLVALLMVTGSLSLKDIVETQVQEKIWNITYQPLGFLLFLICTFAELNRAPFDLPESENELVGGYHSEYSSMKLGFYLFAEYINMFTSSAIIVCLFLGGYDIPFLDETQLSTNTAAILGFLSLLFKIFIFIFLFIWVRWTIPRFRYDQLMHLGWKKLFPLALINMLITGVLLILKN